MTGDTGAKSVVRGNAVRASLSAAALHAGQQRSEVHPRPGVHQAGDIDYLVPLTRGAQGENISFSEHVWV